MKLIILSLITFSAFGNMKEFEMTSGEFKLINGTGDTVVKGTDSSKLKVSYEKKKWNEKCSLDFKQSKSVVKVTVNNDKNWFSSNRCEVNFNIELPKKVSLNIATGSGDAVIKNVVGNVTFKTGSGDLNIETSFIESLIGKLGSGDVTIKGSFKLVDIKTGSGDLAAVYSEFKKVSSLDVRTGSGDTIITLPNKSTTSVDFKSGVGQLKNKTMYSEKPDLKISVKTGSGDLDVNY